MFCSILNFFFKLILLREFTISAWSTYGTHFDHRDVRSSTPFVQPPDVFVSGCGHLSMVYCTLARRDMLSTYWKYTNLWALVFVNDEGGYIEIPCKETFYGSGPSLNSSL